MSIDSPGSSHITQVFQSIENQSLVVKKMQQISEYIL